MLRRATAFGSDFGGVGNDEIASANHYHNIVARFRTLNLETTLDRAARNNGESASDIPDGDRADRKERERARTSPFFYNASDSEEEFEIVFKRLPRSRVSRHLRNVRARYINLLENSKRFRSAVERREKTGHRNPKHTRGPSTNDTKYYGRRSDCILKTST